MDTIRDSYIKQITDVCLYWWLLDSIQPCKKPCVNGLNVSRTEIDRENKEGKEKRVEENEVE